MSWGFAAVSVAWLGPSRSVAVAWLRLLGCLFGLLSVLARSDLSEDAGLLVLRHENQVLRRHLSGRLGWDHADRLWLAASRPGDCGHHHPSEDAEVTSPPEVREATWPRRQRPPDIETQPVRDAADLRSIRRKPAAAGLINEYHHAA